MNEPDAAEAFYYFAYGSNMLTCRLTADDRAPSARAVAVGYVCGRRLAFDKVGRDGSGKCDAEESPDSDERLFGVVFQIGIHDKIRLDRVEGLGNGYLRETVDVLTGGGSLAALTYVARKKSAAVRPFGWYKALVLAGAVEHGLPAAYVEKIRTVEALADPDKKRRNANHRLLPNG